MGRWSHLDSDDERLPDGMVRVGYDADTQVYTYRDRDGSYWEGAPGCKYGRLYRVQPAPLPRPRAHSSSSDSESDSEDDSDSPNSPKNNTEKNKITTDEKTPHRTQPDPAPAHLSLPHKARLHHHATSPAPQNKPLPDLPDADAITLSGTTVQDDSASVSDGTPPQAQALQRTRSTLSRLARFLSSSSSSFSSPSSPRSLSRRATVGGGQAGAVSGREGRFSRAAAAVGEHRAAGSARWFGQDRCLGQSQGQGQGQDRGRGQSQGGQETEDAPGVWARKRATTFDEILDRLGRE
ncbi:48f9a77f-bdbc-45b7-8cf8-497a92e24739 [Thermothielavioides terrestris]|uniref:48f9a77f-bdbc-45b7-8cf8-497a92e24739 n=1 Tax=Thermothielavioides terrestris TaxID=2587410 RepID=A0A3S4C6J6_9PEZI|nr:48f9a77f-bdbc-45b7-8cf8-497a92e24739 [Thermothielavioides terrestris]